MTTETDQMPESVTHTEFQNAMLKVDQRFDAVDQRFDAVDQRFDAIDQRFITFKTELIAELLPEIARLLKSSEENMRAQFRALD